MKTTPIPLDGIPIRLSSEFLSAFGPTMHQSNTVEPRPESGLLASNVNYFSARSHPSRSADVAIHTDGHCCPFNLPGWRWATIKQVALDRLSRSLHSDVCDSDGLRDAAIHSTISGSGGRRDRATSNRSKLVPTRTIRAVRTGLHHSHRSCCSYRTVPCADNI